VNTVEKIAKIVKKAGELILSAHGIDATVTEKEGCANFVTWYDVAVQRLLFDLLAAEFPDAEFVGEEEDDCSDSLPHGRCFVIDPIDGTTNFIRNFSHSAVSVALLADGVPQVGVVYNPYADEMFTAERGEGAFLNGRPISVSQRGLADSIVLFGSSPYYPELAGESFALARKLFDLSCDIRRTGSAALDLCYIASGRCDLFFELKLSPWDYAAGSLIVTEAGGVCRSFDGGEPDFAKGCGIVAANPAAYEDYLRI
jgi:myo-inositol-1(or 4)-monophosphatase